MTEPVLVDSSGVKRGGRSARVGRRAPWFAAAIAMATAAFVNLPLAYVFVRAFARGSEVVVSTVFSRLTGVLLTNTILLLLGVIVLTVLIAVPAAWLVTRVRIPGRRVWAVLMALPLVLPSYIAAFTLVALLGPRGIIADAGKAFGIERLPEFIYGYPGALITIGFFSYPYVFLPVVGALRDLDPSFEESSRTLGHGPWATFFRVVLPQLRPSIVAGTLLVTLYVLSDFGAVSIVRYNTFTLGIYDAYRALFDRTVAAILSSVLVLLTIVLLYTESRLSGHSRASRVASRQPRLLDPGPWKIPSLLFLSGAVTIGVIVPMTMILIWFVRGLSLGEAFDAPWSAALNSVGVSLAAAVIVALLAVPIAWWRVRYPSLPSRLTERLSWSGHALPGIVIALAIVFFATRFARPFYQTLVLLIAGYVVRFLPEGLAAIRSKLVAISPVYEEAARSLGRSPREVLQTIVLPLLRPGILTGAALVFLTTMKELPATLILRPIGFETLATSIWTAAAEASWSAAAIPSALLILASGVPLYFLVIRNVLGRAEDV